MAALTLAVKRAPY
ncbi:uncharacterized protein FTOL_13867 [Fusarium torulosum]|uniref:Uncharacterized protein n=1 Tax=Fusarium torulosum TaxID=33205 RepID=A0AAE8MPC0_9HYPO|nr:uncharacterized protein FTOL_13867 [Fusarium torulosum]